MKADPTYNIPTNASEFNEWKQWHMELRKTFGRKIANQLFTKAWKFRGSNSANTRELRLYLDKFGIKIPESGWDKIVDLGGDVTDYFSDTFKIAKYAGLIIGGIMVAGLGVAVYNIAKNPGGSARAFLTKGA